MHMCVYLSKGFLHLYLLQWHISVLAIVGALLECAASASTSTYLDFKFNKLLLVALTREGGGGRCVPEVAKVLLTAAELWTTHILLELLCCHGILTTCVSFFVCVHVCVCVRVLDWLPFRISYGISSRAF